VIWDIEQVQLLNILASFRVRRSDPTVPLALLDFACGTGRVLALLSPRVDSAVGVDVSESMLEVARELSPDAEILHADITRESVLADRRFDLITAFRFFPNAEPALREDVMHELAGQLTRDGILVLNNHLRCSGTKMRLRRLVRRFRSKDNERDFHCMSDLEVEALASRCGLEVTEVHSLAIVPVLSEKRPLLPRWLLAKVESWASDRASVARLANTSIYVLRLAGAPQELDDGVGSRQ